MLIAGTGSTNFRETLELNHYAKELGYDAVMVITPYYFLSKVYISFIHRAASYLITFSIR
jgi:dihydrodipicolinate synthase/N-acetylneuraminate lyase